MYVPDSQPYQTKLLPTMYDLPSEDPEEPGLPDEYHDYQPELLRQTCRPRNHPLDQIFIATDLNLYYDSNHLNWYKRPDWFVVLGASRFYRGEDLRLSYVMWQENITPLVVVELLSPGTEDEDLGITPEVRNKPPTKWRVYEEILQIPYYFVFSRYTNQLRVFQLIDNRYCEQVLTDSRFWIPELELGIGLWEGNYQGFSRLWLRWYDASGDWVLTPEEFERQRAELERQRAESESQRAEFESQRAESESQRAESESQRAKLESQRAESERQRANRLAEILRDMGINPDDL
ncbi:MAG: Uma2 family endonuclease [Oscillatoriales cyanobacterium]|nr:MAG: Uma2 family endonuclease [Oscillatoriales cyanobacterium]TAE18227.1 MAG: Uma2 family endonuclease [Oscillatoriales cyanobacterium]TAE36689.1 MAG: Uma2 family endonuclease [Oscillatoriales cyanobacterium]